jgi:nucleoside-diphosphate-sugar epimerase
MANYPYILPQRFHVLVTGASGSIVSHVVNKLLSLGYLVRGTVRVPKPWLNKYFEQKYRPNVFEPVFVESFGHEDELEKIMEGVHSGVQYVRSHKN